jgi:hypothetical protein
MLACSRMPRFWPSVDLTIQGDGQAADAVTPSRKFRFGGTNRRGEPSRRHLRRVPGRIDERPAAWRRAMRPQGTVRDGALRTLLAPRPRCLLVVDAVPALGINGRAEVHNRPGIPRGATAARLRCRVSVVSASPRHREEDRAASLCSASMTLRSGAGIFMPLTITLHRQ